MKVICAYPANLDAIHNLSAEEISLHCPQAEPGSREGISSLGDLCAALLLCLQEGSGKELLIEKEDVARKIEGSFPWRYRLGGNAAIMADVLAQLGAQPVLNAPALSRRMAALLHPGVRVPLNGLLTEPLLAAGDQEMLHFVLQFSQGTSVVTSRSSLVAPRANRLIATYDPLNSRLAATKDFEGYCSRKIGDFAGALISGFHLVPYPGFEKIFRPRIEQVQSWKDRNPELYVHAEMGSFQKAAMMERLMKDLPADSIGLNEDELAMVSQAGQGWRACMAAAERLRDRLEISRVAVHTGDYILSVTREFIPAEKEVAALAKGAEAAAAVAATGRIGGAVAAQVNPEGQAAAREFCKEGGRPWGRGAYQAGDVIRCLVPALQVRRPSFTVGLGDTTTAAIFYQEILTREDLGRERATEQRASARRSG
jgi:ADP-dependent phosphofructokinase/glucokinase